MTDLHETEQALTSSLTTIRAYWSALLNPATSGAQNGGSATNYITLDDHDERDHDIDRATRIVSLRREVVDVLNAISRWVMEERPVTKALPDGLSALSMSLFLERHASWIAAEDDGYEVDRLAGLANRVQNLAVPRKREWISLGSCPLEVEFDPAEGVEVCTGQVRAWPAPANLSREERARLRLPSCRRCGTEATVEWWQSHILGNSAASPLVTATDLIAVVAFSLHWVITHDQIRQWKSRGKIEGAGKDAKGRTLYRHAEVIESIRQDVAKQRERKGSVSA